MDCVICGANNSVVGLVEFHASVPCFGKHCVSCLSEFADSSDVKLNAILWHVNKNVNNYLTRGIEGVLSIDLSHYLKGIG